MIQGSHLLEPPPRSEEVIYEWKCDKCGLAGSTKLGTHDPAAKIFTQMKKNHDQRSRTGEKMPDRAGHFKLAEPACRHPRFAWARVV